MTTDAAGYIKVQ